ncbi:MAG TPA: acyl carrier protein [Myxococcota bacterium]|nr:acyl carrier protein [Myxococcota bacterium]
MNRDEILQRVQAVFTELFEIEPERVQPAARLVEDLDLDSIDAIDMVVKLQELIGKRVEETELRRVRTVEDIIELVFTHTR